MAMSRSLGGTSLTTSPPIAIVAAADLLEPGDHAQGRALAAARRPDQDDEFLVGDVEVDTANGQNFVVFLMTLRNVT